MIFDKIFAACKYHIKDKWEFIYLEIDLTAPTFSLPAGMDNELSIRIAEEQEMPKIISDIGKHLTGEDRRQIQRIGEKEFSCFTASRNDKIIHFFLVYENAGNSLLAKTPFDKEKIHTNDVYLGSAFTVPESRGSWVVPVTLMKILQYLKDKKKFKRALVLVHKDTPGAVGFYQRLGFKIVENPVKHNLFYLIAKTATLFYK